ncbi:hypothetical protein RHS04_08922 [Rhizoctonia solani]|uniref:Uncharacterized protein n=1 Tax=Rhizoctonia solani TaxID=456999 RepID=A0A8H7LIT1_9AGAM|nr:hypothetical protein RHS04_08922 [Rhizoctonia solani]
MDLDTESDLDNNNNDSFNLGIELAENNCNMLLPVEVDFTKFKDPIEQIAGAVNDSEIPNPTFDEPPLLHKLICKNPPVGIQTWPNPLEDDPDSDLDKQLELGYPEIDGPNCDPEYVKQDNVPRVDPDNEPMLTEDEMRQALEFDFGDMLDNELNAMHSPSLSNHDRQTLQFLAARICAHFSRSVWDDLRFGAYLKLVFTTSALTPAFVT